MIVSQLTSADLGTWMYALGSVIQIAATVTILVTINSKQKREVSFAGQPVDQKEFERMVAENSAVHDEPLRQDRRGGARVGRAPGIRLDKFEAESHASRRLMHQNISAIGNDVAALKKEAEAGQPAGLPDGREKSTA